MSQLSFEVSVHLSALREFCRSQISGDELGVQILAISQLISRPSSQEDRIWVFYLEVNIAFKIDIVKEKRQDQSFDHQILSYFLASILSSDTKTKLRLCARLFLTFQGLLEQF